MAIKLRHAKEGYITIIKKRGACVMSKWSLSKVNLGGVRGLEGTIPFGPGFNLVLGPNNSGKTTVLETAYITIISNFTDLRESLSLFFIQESSRGSPKHAMESLVGVTQVKPCVRVRRETGVEEEACATLSKSIGVVSRGPRIENEVTLTIDPNLRNCTIRLKLMRQKFGVNFPQECTEGTLKAGIITSGIIPYNTYDGIIGLLKRVFPKIMEDLSISLDGEKHAIDLAADPWNEMVVIVSSGKEPPVPFYAVGRGVQRTFQIMTFLNIYDILLIDEIESSLHPELMKQLAKRIVEHARNKQIIATSQSIEASTYLASAFIKSGEPTANRGELIEALERECKQTNELENKFSLIVLDKQGNRVKGLKLDGCNALWHIAGSEDPRLSYVLMRE